MSLVKFFDRHRKKPLTEKELISNPIPPSQFSEQSEPENYLADAELETAVNVSLLTGKPLLVTGEPGTGKTQLASRIAWELNMPLYKLEVKSTTQAIDLFYQFNMVGYFRSAQIKQKIPARNFVAYKALGEAILQTKNLDEVVDILPEKYTFNGAQRSVVLIDEIDKAPRDFPNDILNELEEMYFKIPELENKMIKANPDLAPIVIMTSNSEKNLPDAFLRRCIFHHINFPTDRTVIEKILINRVKGFSNNSGSALASQLLDIFQKIRTFEELEKKPSIGELIVWADAIVKIKGKNLDRIASKDVLNYCWGILLKKEKDIQFVNQLSQDNYL